MRESVRILIVDDHDVVRRGLQSILTGFADLEVIGTAASGQEALELAASMHPDIVLLDLQMPGMHGLEVIARLVNDEAPPAIIVLTVHDDDEIVSRAVKAGARGYVLKHASGEDLIRVIRHVAAGGRHFDEVVVRALLNDEQRVKEQQLLTAHEVEVLKMVAAGATNREVGEQLFLSPDTVKSHLETIYRKLEVSDRAHAVAVAMRKGLLR
jgi:DNA-binding NarL/FixJ family response regulator